MIEAEAVIQGEFYELVITTEARRVTASVLVKGEHIYNATPEWTHFVSRDELALLPQLVAEAAQAWERFENEGRFQAAAEREEREARTAGRA